MSNGETIRVLGIAGSLRAGSYNRWLIHAAREGAADGIEITEFDLKDIPLYNADVEAAGLPESVAKFKDAISAHDALLIATPEYNYGIPGVLKNAFDWASRPPHHSPLNGKPTAIMGASMGMMGTVRAQLQLRQALLFTDSPTVRQPEVYVARAQTRFNESGYLTDEATRGVVRNLLQSLRELVEQTRAAQIVKDSEILEPAR